MGRMVAPACPPKTGTSTWPGRNPLASAKKVLARSTSSEVTPISLAGSYTPAFLMTSATIGTVEFTGLEITFTTARGQCKATPWARVLTIDALVLKRSSRVMPGLRGTPAGITTTSAPASAAPSDSLPTYPITLHGESMWLRSAATPGVFTMSYSLSSEISGLILSSMASGWPIPPAAPSKATVNRGLEVEESPRTMSTLESLKCAEILSTRRDAVILTALISFLFEINQNNT
mmetsp:Transcript_33781/g.46777  ORF Transcript_33781/g.46777 Transcript_33781/m.46777 type:complete len:233 (-) Transcript_33781:62-760(-)